MSRKLNAALPPQRNSSFRIAALGLLAVFASSAQGQGAWAEPACGSEVSCGVEASCDCAAPACGCEAASICEPACGQEPACGCETACSCEPACGAEPACGCEPEQCGCEPACGAEPACGFEPGCTAEPACGCELSSGCGGCDGGEKGLLSNGGRHKKGPVFHVLDKVAGGLERLATHRILPSHRTSRKNASSHCQCSHCGTSSHSSVSTYGNVQSASPSHMHHAPMPLAAPHQHPMMSQPMQTQPAPMSSALPPTPQIPEPIRDPGTPKTTILRTKPSIIPTPAPQGGRNERRRPGSLFDQMTNPFEDDSASRTSKRPAAIQRTTFSEDNHRSSGQAGHRSSGQAGHRSSGQAGPTLRKISTHSAIERDSYESDEYTDYFQR